MIKSIMKIKRKVAFIIAMIAIMILAGTNITYGAELDTTQETRDYTYLSDISYQSAKVGWGKLTYDKTDSYASLNLYVNGSIVTFKKGIYAHATSNIIYDLTNYKEYDYFTTYYGVNQTSGNKGNGVKFFIYTSIDGENWELKTEENPSALMSSSEAKFVKIDIRDANYLRLYAYDNGANGNDHSVWADSKLIKEGYNDNVTKTVEEYDEIIKSQYTGGIINSELELILLQRELVNNVGQYQLRTFVEDNQEHKETLEWLMNDVDILREYIVGGKPNGSYLKSLEVLSELYHTYREDFDNDLYTKMMISLSLSHSKTVRFWINDRIVNEDGTISTNTDITSPNISNAVNRYQIYKELYLDGKLNNDIFENLEVEEMRYIMSSDIPDDEIKWLRDYTESKGSTNPYSYLKYTTTVSYWNEKYYSAENREAWDQKYNFSSYGIDYKSYYPRLWIVFEEGGVCWQISNTGQNIYSSYGIPSTTVGQPGHVAYLVYSLNSNGDGMWNIWNDVSGWTKTNAAGYSNYVSYYNIRWMNDWGSGSYASSYMGSYILLAQAAINDFEGYKTSEELLLLANTYQDDNTKLEEIYRNALEAQNINFDAWYGLVNLYVNDSVKTEEDLYALATEMTSCLKYYPLPMYDLLRIINNKIESTEYSVKFTLLQTKVLTEASKATSAESIQPNIVKIMANYLLGQVDTEVATFAFDGENAGVLSLSSRYEATNATWDYSLDGGNTWTQTTEHSVKLTEDELNHITVENDIRVHIVGTNYKEENIYIIDILKATLPTNLYANDKENRLINATNTMEWKLNENDTWTAFSDCLPDLAGDKILTVRVAPTGVYLPSDTKEFEFHQEEDVDTHQYIPIKHLSIYQVSSEATANAGHAVHAIDGDINTIWHTAYDGSDAERYIVIKLDEPVYVSALEYVPRQSGSNGRIKNGNVLVSVDGENWTDAAAITNWANDNTTKEIIFNESLQAQYVKLVVTQNYGDGRNFASALMINLYEDITKKEIPTAEVQYDITTSTNQAVTAKLVNPSTEITITNNDGKDTYVFYENGEFTFTFVDQYGNEGSATAIVDWIKEEEEKEIRTGDVDGDGEITINDLAMLKLHYIEMQLLEGDSLKAADIDKDGEITVNDIAQIKLVLIGLMEIE